MYKDNRWELILIDQVLDFNKQDVKEINLESNLNTDEDDEAEKMNVLNEIFRDKIKPRKIKKKGVFVRRVKKKRPNLGFFD